MGGRRNSSRGMAFVAASVIVLGVAVFSQAAQAQTFTVLHTFNEHDGWQPDSGLSMDQSGDLYGTTGYGGNHCSEGCGTVFKPEHKNSSWVFYPLYAFSGPDGNNPQARVIFGPDGNLYGTTTNGGSAGKGEVFRLQPPAHFCESFSCPWTLTVLYSFQGAGDGANPTYGDLVFDHAGNIYGTTPSGGSSNCRDGCGTVYELSPANGGWTEKILYNFSGGSDGANPYAGVIFDNAGNLYGTTASGGLSVEGEYCGVVYKLTPSGNGWTESVLYSFTGGSDGCVLEGGLIFDTAGNLYGVTYGFGIVYELTPSNGSWTFNVLYDLNAYLGSIEQLTMDAAGNLYGTLESADEVFKLTPSNGGWTQTGFSGSAGNNPVSNVILDADGNLYATASEGGAYNAGVVFEITP